MIGRYEDSMPAHLGLDLCPGQPPRAASFQWVLICRFTLSVQTVDLTFHQASA